MGWRRGHSVKDGRASSDAHREATKAFFAFSTDENTKDNSDSMVSESEMETSSLDTQFNEDVYAGYEFDQTYVIEDEQQARSSNDNRLRLTSKEHDVLPCFEAATNSDFSVERVNPPKVPKDFVARHKFSGPLEAETKPTASALPDVPPPADNNLKLMIKGFATFISRCGK